MRAAFFEGDRKIRVGECMPKEPAEGEVQLAVSHCGVCGTDLHIYHGRMRERVHPAASAQHA
jgi:threonine dehydrogenase-like Zn-dependent dehydrogenase